MVPPKPKSLVLKSDQSYIKANNLTKIVADRILPEIFCHQTIQYGCLRTPLDPSNQDLTF